MGETADTEARTSWPRCACSCAPSSAARFAVAASDLGLTPSAVSKLLLRLEARLGVRLVNRTTRKLALTAEGETYFHSGRRPIEAVDSLEQEVAASAGHPRGCCASIRRFPWACIT